MIVNGLIERIKNIDKYSPYNIVDYKVIIKLNFIEKNESHEEGVELSDEIELDHEKGIIFLNTV